MEAVAVMAPTLFKPADIGNLVSYLSAVAKHVPNTPFFYYDINVLTGVLCEYINHFFPSLLCINVDMVV